ncbi:6186_t:CDS:2 [Funneliformis caledonium]|uniref:6186_t:CDS:1 n=1 Tax=Funneliformis caledonium TaxID=1117310 RepID=A0A9N9NLX6_9GLOM|nr:6186_t:CDS:2 [Funneliformis caledonium]
MTIIFKIVVKRQIDVGLQQVSFRLVSSSDVKGGGNLNIIPSRRPLRPSNIFCEQAIDQSHNNLNIKDIKGHILEIAWGSAGPKSKVQAETFQILFFPA